MAAADNDIVGPKVLLNQARQEFNRLLHKQMTFRNGLSESESEKYLSLREAIPVLEGQLVSDRPPKLFEFPKTIEAFTH